MNIEVYTYSGSYQQPIIDLILNIQQNEFGVPVTLEAQPDLKSISSFYQKAIELSYLPEYIMFVRSSFEVIFARTSPGSDSCTDHAMYHIHMAIAPGT